MNSNDATVKIQNRLSKVDSQDARNIKPYYMEEAVNKAMYDYIRRNLHGGNQYREGDEETVRRVDDFQFLLKSAKLSVQPGAVYCESFTLPPDWNYHKRVTPNCTKGVCDYVQIRSTLIEEANVDEYLRDYDSQPSFDFEETFHTMIGNKIRMYHNGDFTVVDLTITYYRNPLPISFTNANDLAVTWEWKQDVAEQIVDEAVKILAGDIESVNQNALADGRVEKNN